MRWHPDTIVSAKRLVKEVSVETRAFNEFPVVGLTYYGWRSTLRR
jgi:hypothetical protein